MANIIPFYAINNIGAPMFTVVMQLKIFATAGFSTCMLGRSYSATKWRALVLLVVGCILVSSPILNHSPSPPPTLQTNATNIAVIPSTPSTSQSNSSFLSIFDLLSEIISSYGPGLLGLCATLLQATISGFTAVYFEALLKDKDDETTIWERNFQLAFYSIVVMIITVVTEQIISDPTLSTSSEPLPVMFSNWTILAFIIAILQAFGGLLVAGTLRYADSVLKCFATAVSIGLTSIVGYFFLGNQVDFIVTLGYVVTIISIFNYTLDATPIGVFGNSNSCNGSDPTNYHPVKDIDEENCYDMNGVENYPKDLRRKVEN